MKVPFIILSYGNFNTNRKIFSCEMSGVHSLPIFSDAAIAQLFVQKMNDDLRELGCKDMLVVNICDNKQYAYDMLVTISSFSDVTAIVVNPMPPNVINISTEEIETQTIQIDEAISKLHSELGLGGATDDISKQE